MLFFVVGEKERNAMKSTSKVIYGNEVAAAVGTHVWVAEKPIGENLMPGSDFSDSSFPGCDFYFPVGGPIKQVACNIHVTGKTLQWKHGVLCVKVKIEWVGDGEPSTFCPGWMKVGN
jgi:hypothetical protein